MKSIKFNPSTELKGELVESARKEEKQRMMNVGRAGLKHQEFRNPLTFFHENRTIKSNVKTR